jgi:hypothetical protein
MAQADAVIEGVRMRFRPVTMTATVAALGPAPFPVATGPGSEVQRPLAVLDGEQQLLGRTLNVADVAATALEHGLTVGTRNVRDFEGLGLTVFNPWDAE